MTGHWKCETCQRWVDSTLSGLCANCFDEEEALDRLRQSLKVLERMVQERRERRRRFVVLDEVSLS